MPDPNTISCTQPGIGPGGFLPGIFPDDDKDDSQGLALGFAGGSGTPSNPYKLSTIDNLRTLDSRMSEGMDFTGMNFVLSDSIVIPEGTAWESIGNATRNDDGIQGTPFKGIFDGNGKTISGISINDTGEADTGYGLFAAIAGSDTVVKNLTVSGSIELSNADAEAGLIAGYVTEGATISGCSTGEGSSIKAGTAGGIAAKLIGSGTIENCQNNADITSLGNAGDKIAGIVATSYPRTGTLKISGSVNHGNINAHRYSAGIVGIATETEIINSSNEGNISGSMNVGGIVGRLDGGSSINSGYNSGTITITADPAGSSISGIGGIAGLTQNGSVEISGVTNKGSITVASGSEAPSTIGSVGGIIGRAASSATIRDIVNDSSASIEVTGGSSIGGIVGSLITSDAAGNRKLTISGTTENKASITGKTFVGGIIGSSQTTVEITAVNSGDVTAEDGYAGGIAGSVHDGIISKCTNTGSITSGYSKTASAGGIMGSYDSIDYVEIKECTNRGTITCGWLAGGITGGSMTSGSSIIGCYNYGTINGKARASGIAAEMGAGSSISNSQNSGTLSLDASATSATAGQFGGIVGRIYTTDTVNEKPSINACTSKGTINIGTEEGHVGGIAGAVWNLAEICNADSSNTITASGDDIGGIIGLIHSEKCLSPYVDITDCDFSGEIPEGKNTIVGTVHSSIKSNVTFENCNGEDPTGTQ